jgi:hypothetical protein
MIKLKIIQKNYNFRKFSSNQISSENSSLKTKMSVINIAYLDVLYQLCPKTTIISFFFNEKEEKYFQTLLKFKELSELTIYIPSYFESAKKTVIKYLKSLKQNKLEKISFKFNYTNKEDICEYYEVLFDCTNLTSFKRENNELSLKESIVISKWLSNSLKNKPIVKELGLHSKLKLNSLK